MAASASPLTAAMSFRMPDEGSDDDDDSHPRKGGLAGNKLSAEAKWVSVTASDQ